MSTPPSLTLADGVAEAVVVPRLGAGLATYDLLAAGTRLPLFRPCRAIAEAAPFDLANNLLLPWSNRISTGGFRFAGKFHRLEPNLPGEAYPIHGNGFSSVWTVETVAADRVELSLTSDGPGSFCYTARASYALKAGALTMSLAVVNRAAEPLPFGLGFHPWIVRTGETFLQAEAERVVFETTDHLPSDETQASARPEWSFASQRALPAGWINNAFLGWKGRARIFWLDRKLALDIEADPPLQVYILYSPSAVADFVCFEPVTHPVDAHNRPGGPEANGLIVLEPGQSLSATCRFLPRHVG